MGPTPAGDGDAPSGDGGRPRGGLPWGAPWEYRWGRRGVSVSLGRAAGGEARRRGSGESSARWVPRRPGFFGAAGGEQRPPCAHRGAAGGALARGGLRLPFDRGGWRWTAGLRGAPLRGGRRGGPVSDRSSRWSAWDSPGGCLPGPRRLVLLYSGWEKSPRPSGDFFKAGKRNGARGRPWLRVHLQGCRTSPLGAPTRRLASWIPDGRRPPPIRGSLSKRGRDRGGEPRPRDLQEETGGPRPARGRGRRTASDAATALYLPAGGRLRRSARDFRSGEEGGDHPGDPRGSGSTRQGRPGARPPSPARAAAGLGPIMETPWHEAGALCWSFLTRVGGGAGARDPLRDPGDHRGDPPRRPRPADAVFGRFRPLSRSGGPRTPAYPRGDPTGGFLSPSPIRRGARRPRSASGRRATASGSSALHPLPC